MNVIIPMTGPNRFTDEQYIYPKPIIEINGKTMLEGALSQFLTIEKVKINVALNKNDVKEFNLDEVVKRATEPLDPNIYVLNNNTSGALCTALLIASQLEQESELIIANYDQYFGFSIEKIIEKIRQNKSDFGLVSFESVHPKWSYVRIDENGLVVEAAEKKPISKNALVGFYYFRKVSLFVSAAKQCILNSTTNKKNYFVSEAINECVLNGYKGRAILIDKKMYRKYYDANEVQRHTSETNNIY